MSRANNITNTTNRVNGKRIGHVNRNARYMEGRMKYVNTTAMQREHRMQHVNFRRHIIRPRGTRQFTSTVITLVARYTKRTRMPSVLTHSLARLTITKMKIRRNALKDTINRRDLSSFTVEITIVGLRKRIRFLNRDSVHTRDLALRLFDPLTNARRIRTNLPSNRRLFKMHNNGAVRFDRDILGTNIIMQLMFRQRPVQPQRATVAIRRKFIKVCYRHHIRVA